MQALIDHIVLNVEDEEKMLSFYHEVVGLGLERLAAYRKGDVPFPSVRLNNDTVIDLFPKRLWRQPDEDPKGQPKLNHFCLACSRKEWDALHKRLEAKHVEIESGPVDRWGAHGTGLSIYFRDPEGNLLEVRYYEEDSDAVPCLLGT